MNRVAHVLSLEYLVEDVANAVLHLFQVDFSCGVALLQICTEVAQISILKSLKIYQVEFAVKLLRFSMGAGSVVDSILKRFFNYST